MAVWAISDHFRRFGSLRGPEKHFFRRFDLFLAPVRRLDRPLFPAYHGQPTECPAVGIRQNDENCTHRMAVIAAFVWIDRIFMGAIRGLCL